MCGVRIGSAYLHVVEEDGAPESGPRFDVGGLRDLWNGPYIVNGNYDCSRAMKAIADWRPAAAPSILLAVAIVQHHRHAVCGEAELVQLTCSDNPSRIESGSVR